MTTRASDQPYTEADVLRLVQLEKIAAGGVRRLAQRWSLSPAYICDILHGRRRISATICGKLGLVMVEERTVRRATPEEGTQA